MVVRVEFDRESGQKLSEKIVDCEQTANIYLEPVIDIFYRDFKEWEKQNKGVRT